VPSVCSLLLTLLLSGMLLLLPAPAPAEDDGLSFSEPQTIVVGGDRYYPPYEFLDENNQPAGFNVDLTRAIARVMGMEVEIRLGAWGEMRRDLAAGRVDILQGMAFTEERRAEVDFSQPHAVVHQSIWNRRSGPELTRAEELAGHEVIVMRGSVMHDYMLKRGDARLVLTDSLAESLRLLAAGRHDSALVAKLPGLYLTRQFKLSNIEPVAKPLVAQNYGYAVRKGNSSLLARFNEGLTILRETGEYKQIYQRWLGVLEPESLSWQRVVKYLAAVALLLLLVLGGTVVWSRALQKQVASRTRALADEIAERKRAMEELSLRQRQLIQADKMTSLGILVSGVAHEINNPNGVIMLNVPLLQRAFADAQPILEQHFETHGDFTLGWLRYSRMRREIPELLNETLASAGRIKRIVEDLKNFARQEDIHYYSRIDINEVVAAAVRLVEPTLRKTAATLTVELQPDLPAVRGNAQRIEQVMVNLLLNAGHAMEGRPGGIWVTSRCERADGAVVVAVRDEGCGIAAEHLPHLTDPFFTTKREQGGTGLGLSVSAGIVKEHGGRLEFDSLPDTGTTVRLIIPTMQEEPS